MRILLLGGLCTLALSGVPASVWAQSPVVEPEPAPADSAQALEVETPAETPVESVDPFAAMDAVAGTTTETTTEAATEDPFASSAAMVEQGAQDGTVAERASPDRLSPERPSPPLTDASRTEDGADRFTRSLDLLYQGSYLPDLIASGGRKKVEQDLFLDARFDVSFGANANAGVRLLYNHEETEAGSASTHHGVLTPLEYYYRQQFSDGTRSLILGRKHLGWSSGFQWRPADLIENGFSTRNIDLQDPNRYRGVDQIRYDEIREHFDTAIVVSNHARGFYRGEQVAARVGVKGPVDFALMYARNGEYARKYGLVVDSTLPWDTTLALEAVHVDVDRDLIFHPAYFGRTLESLTGIRRYEDVYLSLTKFIDDKRRISVEYFHNGRGSDDGFPRARGAAAKAAANTTAAIDPSIFTSQYLGRNYVYAAYTGHVDKWKLQLKPSVLANVGDGSWIGTLSFKRELGGDAELSLNVNTFHGGSGTEFGAVTHGTGVGVSYVFHLF